MALTIKEQRELEDREYQLKHGAYGYADGHHKRLVNKIKELRNKNNGIE